MEYAPRNKDTFHARVDAAGRVLIPAESRERLGIHAGDTVAIKIDENGLRVTTLEQQVKEIQAYLKQFVTPGESVADELIRERREEAARE